MRTVRHLLCWMAAAALAAAAFPLLAQTPLRVGDPAPLFSGHDQDGKSWKLSRHIGKKLVLLYFYPKDNTAGCTAEACGLRDNMPALRQLGADVVGVSRDGKESHKKFIFKYNLDFPLLTDHGGRLADAYGARMAGNDKMDRRVSFLIGLNGRILHVTDSPDPAVHLKEMMAAIVNLKSKAQPGEAPL